MPEAMSDAVWASTFRDTLTREITIGGELQDLPCPSCRLPRCQRSDYIRCSNCGVNWMVGENLEKDPRIDRFKKLVSDMKKPEKQEKVA